MTPTMAMAAEHDDSAACPPGVGIGKQGVRVNDGQTTDGEENLTTQTPSPHCSAK